MRGIVTSLLHLAAALCLVFVLVLPITEAEAAVNTPTRPGLEISDARYSFWGVNDVLGSRTGPYWGMHLQDPTGEGYPEPSPRGDLAPWLGPATTLCVLLLLGCSGAAPWASRRFVFRLSLAASLLLLVGVSLLLYDTLGLPERIAHEAQAAYIQGHPAAEPGTVDVQGLDAGFMFLLWADLLVVAGTLAALRLRPRQTASPMPQLHRESAP